MYNEVSFENLLTELAQQKNAYKFGKRESEKIIGNYEQYQRV